MVANYGGALVSKIHAHTSHGDPFVRRFMEQVLEEVSHLTHERMSDADVYRSLNHSSRRSKDGSSQAASTTHSRNSLSSSTPIVKHHEKAGLRRITHPAIWDSRVV